MPAKQVPAVQDKNGVHTMKINLNVVLQAVVILVVVGGLRVGWQLNQTMTKMNTIITRIEPLVDRAVEQSIQIMTRQEATEKIVDDLHGRVHDLETGG